MPQCKNCNNDFVIDERDRAYYAKIKVPEPTWCPACRRIRRWAFVNTFTLYQSTCAKTGVPVLSMYNPKKSPIKACANEPYWSDSWDPYEYGRDFDFNKPFFPQLHELSLQLPRQAFDTDSATMVNSDYCNMCGHAKDCYLVFRADFNEGLMYTSMCNKCRNVVASEGCFDCELCYSCVRCENCYNSQYLFQCVHCTDSLFCFDSTNLQHCFGCYNLKNKQYCVYNEQKTPEEYKAFIASLPLGSREGLKKIKKDVEEKTKNRYVRTYFGVKNENVTGNYLNDKRS